MVIVVTLVVRPVTSAQADQLPRLRLVTSRAASAQVASVFKK